MSRHMGFPRIKSGAGSVKPGMTGGGSTAVFDDYMKTISSGYCESPLEKFPLCTGVHYICVSMGAEGAVLVTPNAAYFCPALDIEAKGVQGAGDSMVAGLVYGVVNGELPPQELLRYAMSAAAASVIKDGTEMLSRADFDIMLGKCPQPQVLW